MSILLQMVEATLVLEDAINSNFLSSSWWYWSSASTAAKISTLSALSLRIYALDSAISYEKPLPSGASEEQNSVDPSSPPLQKTPEADHVETPRTRTRASKRRKDLNCWTSLAWSWCMIQYVLTILVNQRSKLRVYPFVSIVHLYQQMHAHYWDLKV